MKELDFLTSNVIEHNQDYSLIHTPFTYKNGKRLDIYTSQQGNRITFGDEGSIAFEYSLIKDNDLFLNLEVIKILGDFNVSYHEDIIFKSFNNDKLNTPSYHYGRYLQCLINLLYLLDI